MNGAPATPGVALEVGIDGIALSPDGQRLSGSITTGDAVYGVETRHLRDTTLGDAELARRVGGPIRIGGGSDGIAGGRDGSVDAAHVTPNRGQRIDPRTHAVTTAFDRERALRVSTSHRNHAFSGCMKVDRAAPDFRIMPIRRGVSQQGRRPGKLA